jgi:hypothetical protein
VRNDLAVTLHKLGLLAECREILKPLSTGCMIFSQRASTGSRVARARPQAFWS